SLIARAVVELPQNTEEARRALYDRARTALVTQLRGRTPRLSEAEVTHERQSLDEAIRRIELGAGLQSHRQRENVQPVPRPEVVHIVRRLAYLRPTLLIPSYLFGAIAFFLGIFWYRYWLVGERNARMEVIINEDGALYGLSLVFGSLMIPLFFLGAAALFRKL